MLLAIDIGNTNIVVGAMDKQSGEIIFIARTSTDRVKTGDQYAIQIKNILELYNIRSADICGAVVSSVVPPVSNAIISAIKTVCSKDINTLLVGPGIKTGLNILMDNPGQVGSDLIVNAIAALKEYKPPLAIVDMGTATTISVIDKDGNYIGGQIIPGVMISLNALSSLAAQLPAISLDSPKKVIGKNTIDCMRSGLIYGNAAMLDGVIERIEEELGSEVTAILTGGVSVCIAPFCKKKIVHDENLLLKGLFHVYNKNI